MWWLQRCRSRRLDRVSLGGPIKFNPKGQVEGNLSACLLNKDGRSQVVLGAECAGGRERWPGANLKLT